MKSEKQQTSGEVLDALFSRYPALSSCREAITQAFELLLACYRDGGKLLVCGNGGSAADSEHIVGELMKSFMFKRPVDDEFAARYRELYGIDVPSFLEGALPAIALVSQTSLSTALANDVGADGVFAQQVYGYGRPGDVLIAISTSGNSSNAVEAAKVARVRAMKVIALTGQAPSKLSEIADVTIAVPSCETFAVQEFHLPVYHALCAALEAELF